MMSEFDFDVVSDVSDLPRRRPPVPQVAQLAPQQDKADAKVPAAGRKESVQNST
jgi:hypothetical protein